MRSLTIGLLVCWIAARLLPGWASWCAALPVASDAPPPPACCCMVDVVVLDDACRDACCHSVGDFSLTAVQPHAPAPVVLPAIAVEPAWLDELLRSDPRPVARFLPPARDGPAPPSGLERLRTVSLQI